MCRIYAFRSSILSRVHQSLVAAQNALGFQSEGHPDGWGIAYYVSRYPHLLKSHKKAMADGLFRELSAVVQTRTLLAHIRRSTTGKNSELNCHPFQHGPWTFAHNGKLEGFGENIELTEACYAEVDARFLGYCFGQTDSEVAFYIFLSHLARQVEDIHHESVATEDVLVALRRTVDVLNRVNDTHGVEPALLNFVVTNGSLMVAYRRGKELQYSTHKTACPESGTCSAYMPERCEAAVEHGVVNHLIVTSEDIESNPNVWVEMKDDEFVSVDHAMTFRRGVLHEQKAIPVLA